MINAPPFSGKTLLLLALQVAQDFNLPIFGRFHPTFERSSLFLGGGDAPAWDYGGQAKKLMLGYGLSSEQMKMSEVYVIPGEGPRITDQSFLDWIVDFHAETGIGLLCIDTLLSVHDCEENSAQEMKRVMKILKHIRDDLKISIIFGHHDTKTTTDKADVYKGRGSSVISGSVDFMLSLRSQKNRVKLTSPKSRGGIVMESNTIYFDLIDEIVDDKPAIRLVPPTSSREQTLLNQLTKEPKTRKELAQAISKVESITYATAYNVVDNLLKNLVAAGRVKQVERGIWGLSSSSY